MLKIIKFLFWSSIALSILALSIIISSYFILKPNLPEISLVDETQLQIPLKVFTEDGILIGEFGEIKRRPLKFNDIPNDLKNAFLAAEDDAFFRHQGISYRGLLRSVIRCLSPRGCVGGGGTISMQVVRGYLLTRDQTIIRKIKEIFLALELESTLSKNEIFELYINRNFFGNRSYGIEAAANTYFNKSSLELTLPESATIAAMAQSPSRINAIKSPQRTKQRRNWILLRMYKLRMIDEKIFNQSINTPLSVSTNIDLYEVDGKYIAEQARQDIISRYGLQAYKEGWSVFTTVNSTAQSSANRSIRINLSKYDKKHGWKEADNFINLFNEDEINAFKNFSSNLFEQKLIDDGVDDSLNSIESRFNSIFEQFPFYNTHTKAVVLNIQDNKLYYINENLIINSIPWLDQYSWARKRITINTTGPKPSNFLDFLKVGDFIYLKKEDKSIILDQIPIAQSSLISIDPNLGAVKAYVGGSNFLKSNFDRVKQSYPQSGSSFKPFIFAAALSKNYNLSSLINDAPIVFDDKNLESIWRPQNYTGKFYGPTSLREALIQSLNIVSIKLLREIGLKDAKSFISKFGFSESRLPNDLSLALGSGNFSPLEMVRAFGVIANGGYLIDPYYISRIEDRYGNIIYSHNDFLELNTVKDIEAFPWLDTLEMNIKKPYYLTKPQNKEERVIDERIAYLIKDTLKKFMKRGSAGRKSSKLNRDDIGGKTGTTNDAVSTWFSGFHDDLVTTVWVGNDDFTSLGENEYGSTTALPIWIDYMEKQLEFLSIRDNQIPEGISFTKVNKKTGKADDSNDEGSYFELFLNENIEN